MTLILLGTYWNPPRSSSSGSQHRPPALSLPPTCTPETLMGPPGLTVVQLAGLGGMGELEVVEVGVLLDWLKTSSSM